MLVIIAMFTLQIYLLIYLFFHILFKYNLLLFKFKPVFWLDKIISDVIIQKLCKSDTIMSEQQRNAQTYKVFV